MNEPSARSGENEDAHQLEQQLSSCIARLAARASACARLETSADIPNREGLEYELEQAYRLFKRIAEIRVEGGDSASAKIKSTLLLLGAGVDLNGVGESEDWRGQIVICLKSVEHFIGGSNNLNFTSRAS